MKPNPFIIITDKDGDIVDSYSDNHIYDDIFYAIDRFNRENSDDAPHYAFKWDGQNFKIMQEIYQNE